MGAQYSDLGVACYLGIAVLSSLPDVMIVTQTALGLQRHWQSLGDGGEVTLSSAGGIQGWQAVEGLGVWGPGLQSQLFP